MISAELAKLYLTVPDPRFFPPTFGGWVVKLLGLMLTALAASLGAPLWFDMLKKIMNVRAAGIAPEEMPPTPKVEPQPKSPTDTPPK